MKHLIVGLSMLGLVGVSACVTEPPPCTPEWVEWKSDQVLTRFARSNYGTVSQLRDFSRDLENPSPLLLLRIASMQDDFTELARDFNRIVLPELNNAVAQCSEPRNFVPAFTGFLRKEGVGENVLEWVEAIGYLAVEQNRY